MNQKNIAILVIIGGILLGLIVGGLKFKEDNVIDNLIMAQGGSCYLADGTCLHDDRDYTLYIFGGIISGVLVLLGIYLLIFDKNQEKIIQSSIEVSKNLEEAKKVEKSKDEFSAFLSGFNSDEQLIIKSVHDQEGILQSTLRFKTSLSKSTLSLILKDLEERKIITKKLKGKSNQIFLVKKF